MKWQSISRDEFDYPKLCGEITIKNYRWLKLLGARLHDDPVRNCWTFRLSYFHCYHCSKPMQSGKGVSIPIPFMKNDHGVKTW